MAENVILGAKKIDNLLNFNKLKLYTDLLRAEMASLYGGGLKFKGTVQQVLELPEEAEEGDTVYYNSSIYEYDGEEWKEAELTENDTYMVSINSEPHIYRYDGDSLSPFEQNITAWDHTYVTASSQVDGYLKLLKCTGTIVLLVYFSGVSDEWYDIVLFNPNSGMVRSICHDYFAAYNIQNTYELIIDEFYANNPVYNRALKTSGTYKFKVLSYSDSNNTISWYNSGRWTGSNGKKSCLTYINNSEINMDNAYSFNVSDEPVLNLQDYSNFIGSVATEGPIEIKLGRYYNNQLYNFEFDSSFTGVSFKVDDETVLTVDEEFNAGDIVTITANKSGDTETWNYSKVKTPIISSDGSVNISRENGITDLTVPVKEAGEKPIRVYVSPLMDNEYITVEKASADPWQYANINWTQLNITLKKSPSEYILYFDADHYRINNITGGSNGQRVSLCGYIIPAFEFHATQPEKVINLSKDGSNIVRDTSSSLDIDSNLSKHTYPLCRVYSEYLKWNGCWWGKGYADVKSVNYLNNYEVLPVSSKAVYNKHYINKIKVGNNYYTPYTEGEDNYIVLYSGDNSISLAGSGGTLNLAVSGNIASKDYVNRKGSYKLEEHSYGSSNLGWIGIMVNKDNNVPEFISPDSSTLMMNPLYGEENYYYYKDITAATEYVYFTKYSSTAGTTMHEVEFSTGEKYTYTICEDTGKYCYVVKEPGAPEVIITGSFEVYIICRDRAGQQIRIKNVSIINNNLAGQPTTAMSTDRNKFIIKYLNDGVATELWEWRVVASGDLSDYPRELVSITTKPTPTTISSGQGYITIDKSLLSEIQNASHDVNDKDKDGKTIVVQEYYAAQVQQWIHVSMLKKIEDLHKLLQP